MLNKEFLKNTINTFKQAPVNFYSPCGRSPLLTDQEIESRKFLAPSSLNVSNKEMVFRKIWEISLLPMNKWELAYPVGLEFLERNLITEKLAQKIMEDLVLEIKALKKAKGRTIHNPYLF